MASKALDNFIASLGIAEQLTELERVYDNPPRKADEAKVAGLRGAAAVLMVASFEAFIKAAIVEHLSELTVQPPKVPFTNLPEKMRVNSVFYCLDAAIKGPRHVKTDRADRLPNIKMACAKIAADIIDPEALSSTQSNPSSNTVKSLFGDLGVSDIFGKIRTPFHRAWRKPEAATFIPDKLEEIVNRRHRVAHTGLALNITRGQLKEALKFLRILSGLLDKELRSHIDSLIPP
ncbi:MAG TPA: HEPN domain-containing protein [Gemmataceae bacterium]|nr:HEPN domain-containing protein [Pirellulales bacterium]HZZ78834.1 HEPN domain-containing protein [Gemmataceae bacterium]